MSGFTRTELLVVLAIVCLLLALLIPIVKQAREIAWRTQSMNNLKQIGVGIHNYHSSYKYFPPGGTFDAGGRGFQGWMVLITPFLDAGDIRNTVDLSQPWDSARNAERLKIPIQCFQIPGELSQVDFREFNQAHYSANAHLFAADSAVQLKEVDSHSQVFMVAELGGDFVPWGCPYNFRPLEDLNGKRLTYGRYSRDGAFILFVDGRVAFMANNAFPTARDSLRGADLAKFGEMPTNIIRPKSFPIPKGVVVRD